jgi:hypothetical protein
LPPNMKFLATVLVRRETCQTGANFMTNFMT